MNKIINVFRAFVEAEDYLKTHNGIDSSIEICISKEDNERIVTDNWQHVADKKCCVSSFEGIPVKIDESLKANEFKIKVD